MNPRLVPLRAGSTAWHRSAQTCGNLTPINAISVMMLAAHHFTARATNDDVVIHPEWTTPRPIAASGRRLAAAIRAGWP